MKNILRALRYFRPDTSRILLVGLLMLAGIAAGLCKPWPLAMIVDSVLGNKPAPAWMNTLAHPNSKSGLLLTLTLATLFIHLTQGILASAQNYLAIKIGLRGLQRVRNELFDCLQKLSPRFYHGSKTGDLIYRATWDTFAFQTLFQQGLIAFLTALLSLLLMVAVMLTLNVRLTFAALATVPLVLFSIKIFGRKMRERGVLAQQADSRLTSFLQQAITTLPLIQSYTREKYEADKFVTQSKSARNQRLSQHGWELVYWLAITIAFSFGTATIVSLGSREVLASRLTIGGLFVFLAYLAQLYEPLNQLSHVGATVSGATASTQRIFEILDTPEEIKDSPSATPITARGNLAFKNVSFGYQPGQQVLKDLSFKLNAGESLAIIGPSGAGKTTLLNLLSRFYDPGTGAISLGGVDLRQLRLQDLRSQVALVSQEPMLLTATIAENIAYGKPDATTEEIEAAASAANAAGFIDKLPLRYETMMGEGEARLSVGEKQRINLARAFLKDAPILLLDEPTSALDAESEALVVASLEKLMQGRTTLIVAHRLSTIRRATKVLVLKDGMISEIGTPEALAAQSGYFAQTRASGNS